VFELTTPEPRLFFLPKKKEIGESTKTEEKKQQKYKVQFRVLGLTHL
jgi:hypothetical protein